MFKLILMTCHILTCSDIQILGEYPTLSACEQAMNERTVEDGSALMCLRDDSFRQWQSAI